MNELSIETKKLNLIQRLFELQHPENLADVKGAIMKGELVILVKDSLKSLEKEESVNLLGFQKQNQE